MATSRKSLNKILVHPVMEQVVQFGAPEVYFLKMNLRRCRKGRLAFVIDHYTYETESKRLVFWRKKNLETSEEEEER